MMQNKKLSLQRFLQEHRKDKKKKKKKNKDKDKERDEGDKERKEKHKVWYFQRFYVEFLQFKVTL